MRDDDAHRETDIGRYLENMRLHFEPIAAMQTGRPVLHGVDIRRAIWMLVAITLFILVVFFEKILTKPRGRV